MMAEGETYIENYEAPMLELMDLYIKFTPKEYRTSFIDFDESYVTGKNNDKAKLQDYCPDFCH